MPGRYAIAASLLLVLFACEKTHSAVESAPNGSSGAGDGATGGSGASDSGATGGATSLKDAGIIGNAQAVYQRAPQRPFPLVVDETHLYWGEGGEQWHIVRAPKSGAGPVEEVGPWGGSEVSMRVIVVDNTHIYWLDDDVIRKVEKASSATSTIQIGAPPLAGGWVLIGDDDWLYFADQDCMSVARVPKSGGEPASFTSIDHYAPGGGTRLAVDEDSLYCGNGTALLRFPKQGGMATKLATVGEGELVGPIVSDNINLYWANNRGGLGSRQENLAMMPKQVGPVTDLGNVGVGSAIMRLDTVRHALYWTTRSASIYDRVLSYSIPENKLTIMAEGYPVYGGNAQDGAYVYWSGRTAIMRLAK